MLVPAIILGQWQRHCMGVKRRGSTKAQLYEAIGINPCLLHFPEKIEIRRHSRPFPLTLYLRDGPGDRKVNVFAGEIPI